MRVLITGGSGFIGSRLSAIFIENGHQVVVFDVRPAAEVRVTYIQGDIRDLLALTSAVKGCDFVVHLAAEHADDVRPAQLYYEVNVEGMRNLIQACEASGINQILFTSTVACYGLDAKNPDESSSLAPFNDYGKSKLLAENDLKNWCNAPQRTVCIIRPSVVFGERNRGNVFNLLRQIHELRFAMIGSGRNRKSMSYVGNIASFIYWCSSRRANPGLDIFNYADKPDLSTSRLVEVARDEMAITTRLYRVPYWMAYSLGSALDVIARATGRRFSLSRIRVKKFCAETVVNSNKAHTQKFIAPFPLEDALRKTINAEFPRPK